MAGQNGVMEWEATDNFGNLNVGVSEASSLEELRGDLENLVEELHHRHPDGGQITVDFEYGEVNGPNPDEVSHVMQVAWLAGRGEDFEAICGVVGEICSARGVTGFEVCRGG